MGRVSHQGIVSRPVTSSAPPISSSRSVLVVPNEFNSDFVTSMVSFAADDSRPKGDPAERRGQLVATICQRIESRLPGRVRNLAVRIFEDTVLLEGQCATYYTKQLAQHAAMGVLEDQQLENAIAVTVSR